MNTIRVLGASNYVITDSRQVLNAPPSDEDNGVFLQVVTNSRDVGSDFITVCEPNPGNLPQR